MPFLNTHIRYIGYFRTLLSFFSKRERVTLFLLVLMMTGGAAVETLGIGLIVPLISVMGNPELVHENKVLNQLYNWINASSVEQFLLYLVFILIVVYVIKNVYLGLLAFVQASFISKKQSTLSHDLLVYYLRQPYVFHLRHNTSELQYNILGAVKQVTGGIVTPVLAGLSEGFVIAFILALLLSIEPWIATITFTIAGGFAWVLQKGFKGLLTRRGQASHDASRSMVKSVNQALGSIKDIKVLGREAFFVAAFDHHKSRFIRSARDFATLSAMPRLLTELLVVGGLLLTTAIVLTWQGALQQLFPMLALIGMAALRIMPSVTRIVGCINSIRFNHAAIAALSHKFPDTRGADENIDQGHAPRPAFEFHSLELRDVDYQYAGDDTLSLSEVSLAIRRGEHVGIVGATGGGKSTLINVMLGLLEPTKGGVLIGADDLRNVREQWQSLIGYVPQSIYLLDDTVRRNVALGIIDSEIDDARVWDTLNAAHIGDKVRNLPKGLDTKVGENGIRLSGGERQRIGIARALYSGPQVMVFDEATSSLDGQTEREITETIRTLSEGLTVIVVTHRLSTVSHCDRIYFVNAGRIDDVGTHDELLSRNKDFRERAGKAPLKSRRGRRSHTNTRLTTD